MLATLCCYHGTNKGLIYYILLVVTRALHGKCEDTKEKKHKFVCKCEITSFLHVRHISKGVSQKK